MSAAIKFCGLTRHEDAASAIRSGASFLGAVLAASPRRRTPEQVRKLFWDVEGDASSVGVFGTGPAAATADTASHLGLDVVQLHGDYSVEDVAEVREGFEGEIWGVVATADGTLDSSYSEMLEAADGILIDSRVAGQSGGTGVPVDWRRLSEALALRGRPRKLILAGGLNPENVRDAIRIVAPDVVDVSSGVERAPGVKDPGLLRDFALAVETALEP